MRVLFCLVLVTALSILRAHSQVGFSNQEWFTDSITINIIDKGKNALYIYASCHNLYPFVIVAKRGKKYRSSLLAVGEKHLLTIKRVYQEDTYPNFLFCYDIDFYGKKILVPSNGWAANVYLCPSLDSLKEKPKDKKPKKKARDLPN